MATGDTPDVISRLQRWLPNGWFPTDAGTRVYSIVSGFAAVLVQIWNAIVYARLQTRLATATDGFLDLASQDFFGSALPRLSGEADPTFSTRIRKEVFRDRDTRNAIDSLLFDMTGTHPNIIEEERPADVGGYRVGYLAFGVAGHWASRAWRLNVFIETPHAGQFGIPNVFGYRGTTYAGFRSGPIVWAGPWMITGTGFTDAQIYLALERIRAAGVTYWVRFATPAQFTP